MTNSDVRSASAVPIEHAGADYKHFSAELSRKRGSHLYLEIGVQNGVHLSTISTDHAIGVDPAFQLSANVAANKKQLELHHSTSDIYFSEAGRPSKLNGRVDLAFLDGFHTFEFLLRDFYNTEKISTRNALIMMHDCLPLNAEMADRDEERSYARGKNTAFPNFWTGDVWKMLPILRKFRPDLRVVCVDCSPTGLVCVSGLDYTSTVLEDSYLAIVDEFRQLPNDLDAIEAVYRDNPVLRSVDVLRDHDHSLYFRI